MHMSSQAMQEDSSKTKSPGKSEPVGKLPNKVPL